MCLYVGAGFSRPAQVDREPGLRLERASTSTQVSRTAHAANRAVAMYDVFFMRMYRKITHPMP